MHLQVQKLDLDIFTYATPGKRFPQVLIITAIQRKITHPLKHYFFQKSVSFYQKEYWWNYG